MERLADAACIGLYEGPLAVVVAPDVVHHVHPQAIVVACGGMEAHQLFKGNDLPGVFLARGAARLAGVHGIKPGDRAVVWAQQPEALVHARTLADAGVAIAAVVTAPGVDASATGFRAVPGEVVEATGKKRVKGVVVRTTGGGTETIACDVLAVGAEIQPNHHLPRLAYDLPVRARRASARCRSPAARSTRPPRAASRPASPRPAGCSRTRCRRTPRRRRAARAATCASARTST